MRQILLHPGFHKTGTSSIQHYLWLNRETLAPYFDLRMFRHMKSVVRAAALFSRTQSPLDLVDMVGLLDAVFEEHPVSPDKDLLISCEGLGGQLPGSPNVKDYGAMPTLITYLCGYLAERFPDAQVKIIFTTRGADDWLYSAYRQHLRGQRLTLDYKAFSARYQSAAQFDPIMSQVALAVEPLPVMQLPMEQAVLHPLGPGAMIVEQMNVPAALRASLLPVGRGNKGPGEKLWQEFLRTNRADYSDQIVAERKMVLAKAASLGGWKAS